MAFQVSPGVQVKEIDATSVVPAVSTSIGGFAGSFNWGPVEQVVSVSSEKELLSTFGTPDDNTALYFLTASAFLKYGNALQVVRAASGHDNATADGSGLLIKNDEHYTNSGYNTGAGSVGRSGDIAKAIACGADAVMMGSPLAKAVEAPGLGWHWGSEAHHGQLPRGERVNVGTVGSLEEILLGPSHSADGSMNLFGALRRSMATCGYSDVKSFQRVEVLISHGK